MIFLNRLLLALSLIVTTITFTTPANSEISSTKKVFTTNIQKLLQTGQYSQAIDILKEEAETYKKENQKIKEADILLSIAKIYNQIGNFNLAIEKLNYILDFNLETSEFNAAVLENLGNAYKGRGDFSKSISIYQKSLQYNNSLSCLNNLVKAWKGLIDITTLELKAVKEKESFESKNISSGQFRKTSNYKTISELEQKISSYEQSAIKIASKALSYQEDSNNLSKIYALVNWYQLTNEIENISAEDLTKASVILESEPSSRTLVFILIEWSKVDIENNLYWLQKAKKIANSIQDPIARSNAVLELGQYFYNIGEFNTALQKAQESALISQSNFLFENLYNAQWLAGRTYLKLNRRENSITAYKNAIAALDTVNQSISSWTTLHKNNFRLETTPLYHELIDLLLGDETANPKNIELAIFIADKLRFVELQNYFGDECFEVRSLDRNQITQPNNNQEATIYSIVLDSYTYIILKSPDGSLHSSLVDMPKSEIEELAVAWRENLTAGNSNKFQIQSRQLYDLLIAPIEDRLNASDFEILIFVHDGILRNLPMSALYDGQKYLVEKWASVSSLGLNDISSKQILSSNPQSLIFGLSRSNRVGWIDLEMVEKEVNLVQKIIGGEIILNDRFTLEKLARTFDRKFYSVVHLATHGFFAGNVNDSFLMAHDGLISIAYLEKILRNQTVIDLLVLSACDTGITSDSALLGLAGVAARNGVSSILGSLWLVQDDIQSEAMEDFYFYLSSLENNKAVALQKVQQKMISQYVHPQNWAALHLIGDYR